MDGKSEVLTDTGTAGTKQHVLDRVVAASLEGQHARFARRHGRALRYENDVAPFFAIEDEHDPAAWADVAELIDGDEVAVFPGISAWPSEWNLVADIAGVQMVGAGVVPKADAEAVRLGPDDVPEMLDLIARTEPGPFRERTVELGTYLGIRRDGALIAMAGERMQPPGWTEISAVCTDPAVRGEGLASRLILAVAHGIRERGETPFLHTGAGNTSAIRLYESLGFRLRRTTAFLAARAPEHLTQARSVGVS